LPSNIVAAYQIIQSGETARSLRHIPAASCPVLDAANGVHTVVAGKRVDMTPSDVVLTPSRCWHAHANKRKSPLMPEEFGSRSTDHARGA
jgi:gentisate 1,2-dioxygenase